MIKMLNEVYKYIMERFLLAFLVTALVAVNIPLLVRAYVNMQELPSLKVEKEEAVLINGVIFDMSKQADKMDKLVRDGKDEIFIVINSGGGVIDAGEVLINRIHSAQYHGVTVTCIVDGMAASMAVVILSQCDNRYGLYGSKIMWHSAAQRIMMGTLTQDGASQLSKTLKVLNDTIWKDVRKYFWPWYFTKHYENETFISVTDIERNSFGFLRVIRTMEIIQPSGEKVKVVK